MNSFLIILLGTLTLLAVSLQRTYKQVPLKELKRRARGGDEFAAALIRAVSYGHSLRAVLWILIGITSAGFFVMLSTAAPMWFALSASGVLIWLGFVWLPAAPVSRLGERFAAWVAPLFDRVLTYFHPFIDWITRFLHRHRPIRVHTGLYDRRDLLDLLEQQHVQADNRIDETALQIAHNALQFGDISIKERMIPRRMVKMVADQDSLGPIVMDELHASGFSRFPVYEGRHDNIVGTLYLHDLLRAKHGGTVHKLMRPSVYYLHEDQSLHDALQAVLKTHHHLFIVVNEFEEFVGIITSEDILEAIVGEPLIDEFDQYDDLRAVAARSAIKEHKDHSEKLDEVTDEKETTEEQTEVVE